MSNYTKSTNFATKDNLTPGDPLKVVRGTEIDTEYNNIATAIATKTDNSAAAITGGSITGITDLAIADGGTGASTAAGALNNLLPSQTSAANKYLQSDGTNASWDAVTLSTADITGTLPVANGGTGVTSSTGTGNVVLSNSPTLVTPALGTPASGVATNLTGLPISTGVSGLGTGVATFLATPSSANLASAVTDETGSGALVFATSPTLVTPALGTPSALVGTNITGTASGLTAGNVTTNANLTGAVTSVGNATSLGSFSSANLLGALTDETGTGSAVFATSPTLVTPILGTPTSATLTNATGLPISTGVSGLGTGVATFLATPSSANLAAALTDETGSGANVFATSPTLVTPILGTPTSATLTNATGLPLTTGVTGTLPTANGGTNLTSFTSGGVVYASSSSALATGSALVFDGTNFGVGTATPNAGGLWSTQLSVYGSGSSGLMLGNATRNLSIAADGAAMRFYDVTGSSEWMRLNATGLGIGTSSPAYPLHVEKSKAGDALVSFKNTSATGDGLIIQVADNAYNAFRIFNSAGSPSFRVKGSGETYVAGNLGVGTTSPTAKQQITSTSAGAATVGLFLNNVSDTASTEIRLAFAASSNDDIATNRYSYISLLNTAGNNSGTLVFATNASGSSAVERTRISSDGTFRVKGAGTAGSTDAVQFSGSAPASAMSLDSSGNLLVGTTSSSQSANVGSKIIPTGAFYAVGDGPDPFSYYNTGGSQYRFFVGPNGGISNFSANNVNLSDRREKTNFAPAGNYLAKICAIPVQTYNYINQNMEEDGGLTLGVVAQDVQEVAPELVTESNWGTEEEPKMRLSIYQTDLQYALMKCIQEQQTIIESLKARLDAANL